MKIAILGNFNVVYSTESHLAWTWRDMGHEVIQLQEDRTSTDAVVTACREHDVKLFQWIHTHGWNTPGTRSLDQMLADVRALGVKTCSFHLDRYWGLNVADGRENRVGAHPFFHTDTVFTADGGNQDRFASRGINHKWLPPAVVKYGCYLGEPQPGIPPVIFTGAEGYHPEYPFRPQVVQRLRRAFGADFRQIQGYREAALNNLYASTRVVAGDSCFAGSPYYWSDRVPEVCGRGGFLIFPETPGLEISGLVTYIPQNADDLIDKIRYYLDPENEPARRSHMLRAHEHVKAHDTYNNRMQTILVEMGLV